MLKYKFKKWTVVRFKHKHSGTTCLSVVIGYPRGSEYYYRILPLYGTGQKTGLALEEELSHIDSSHTIQAFLTDSSNNPVEW